VSVVVADTSIWVDFFRGDAHDDLERALAQGLVVLPPIVCAELLSAPLAPRKRAQLASLLADLPLHPTPFSHWAAVGELRAHLLRKGISVSTPDAAIAQCTIECGGALWSRDEIFKHVAKHSRLRLWTAS
jgi:predicted nucleic acid-binding protein